MSHDEVTGRDDSSRYLLGGGRSGGGSALAALEQSHSALELEYEVLQIT
jgi:hypothetical protein